MLSTIEKDMRFDENGVMRIVPKEYPNWCGLQDVGFIFHNEWSDPELEYEGKRINANEIEDSVWSTYEEFCEENKSDVSEQGFVEYVKENQDEVYELLNNAIEEDE